MGKSSPKAPPAPDYVGAAKETAAGNLEAVKYQTEANRINQYSPYGNLTYSKNPDGSWNQNTSLTPELQHALDAQLATQSGRSDLANKMMGAVANSYGFSGPNASSQPAIPNSYQPTPTPSAPKPAPTGAMLSPQEYDEQMEQLNYGKGFMNSLFGSNSNPTYTRKDTGEKTTYEAEVARLNAARDNYNAYNAPAPTAAPQAAPTPYESNFGGEYSAFNAPQLSSYLRGVNGVNQGSVGQAGQFSSGAKQNTTFTSNTPGLNTSYDRFTSTAPGLNTDVQAFDGANAGQDTRNLAASGYLSGLQDLDQNAPQFDPAQADLYARKAYEAQMSLLRPDLDRQQQSLQNSLALQGLNPGTEANAGAQSSYSLARAAQENALAASSYLSGAQTAQGNFASQLSGFNASNAARTQALQNRLGIQTGDLAAQGQSNAARNTMFNQGVTGYNLNSQAVQAANAARTQQLQNDLSSYGANQSAVTAENTARSNQLAQQLAQYQAQNAASAQQFSQDLGGYGANLSGLTTNAQLQAAQNAAQQQAYGQAVSNYGMDYQAALTARNQPLNELNALLSGQQVQTPQFNSYALQGNGGGADILGATQAQGQYNQNLYNAQAAQAASGNSALAGLAGTAAMAFAMY